MSHTTCRYVDGECELCAADEMIKIERAIKAARGRWMVVQEDGTAYRYPQLSVARAHVRMCDSAGIRAHVRRWRRDRVAYVYLGFDVNDERWLP